MDRSIIPEDCDPVRLGILDTELQELVDIVAVKPLSRYQIIERSRTWDCRNSFDRAFLLCDQLGVDLLLQGIPGTLISHISIEYALVNLQNSSFFLICEFKFLFNQRNFIWLNNGVGFELLCLLLDYCFILNFISFVEKTNGLGRNALSEPRLEQHRPFL